MINFILEKKKYIFLIFLALIFFDALSFISYFYPIINTLVFVFLLVVFLFLSIYRFKYSIYFVFAELFSNSMGYVFYLENSSFKISLRIALWLIIISVSLAKILFEFFKNKKTFLDRYSKMPLLKNFLILFLFIAFSLVFGIFKNGFSDAFFDFNAWLYFALIIPFYYIISSFNGDNNKKERFKLGLVCVFLSSVLFLIFKSLLFLFLFSHNLQFIISDIYYWTRLHYLGEITAMSGGFYRIFLQSQIFILLAFIISISFWTSVKYKKNKIYLFIFLSFLSSTLILSFSRSFWLAGFCVLAILFLFLWVNFTFKKMAQALLIAITSFVVGFLIVLSIVNFPWPKSSVSFNLDSISERANISSGESAISSRWALLEVMKGDIYTNILLGRGFGARLEYKSSDPRVLERSADGIYSTYAFEWGWFDICLKLGLFGLASYLLLLFIIIKNLFQSFTSSGNFIYLSLILSLFALIIVNFFTPYLNHPLGIGFLILIVLFFSDNKVCLK